MLIILHFTASPHISQHPSHAIQPFLDLLARHVIPPHQTANPCRGCPPQGIPMQQDISMHFEWRLQPAMDLRVRIVFYWTKAPIAFARSQIALRIAHRPKGSRSYRLPKNTSSTFSIIFQLQQPYLFADCVLDKVTSDAHAHFHSPRHSVAFNTFNWYCFTDNGFLADILIAEYARFIISKFHAAAGIFSA